MKKIALSIVCSILPILFFVSCTSKKDRLVADTLTINIEPATASLAAGGTLSLKAICRSAKSDNVDIAPVWSVENSLGSFSPSSGKSATFTAGNSSGSGKIYATYQGIRGEVGLTVTGTGGGGGIVTYSIYNDSFATDLDAPGTFKGGGDAITLVADTTESSEGAQSFKATFSITEGGWAGWYVSASTTKDMSAYSSGHLQFDIKTAYDIQIGIRSDNINSVANTAKRYISSYITPNGTMFQSVSVPISDFVSAQPGTDLSQMKDMFIASAIGDRIHAQTNKTFAIDNIRWTSN
jgi:hypothetical protein